MQNIKAGLVAGFVATVVLSAMMVAKTMMGIMPELDVIGMRRLRPIDVPLALTGPVAPAKGDR